MSARRLEPADLRRRCDPAKLGFATTAELPDFVGLLGQERAAAALELGVALRAHDFNIFVLGPAGLGKHELARRVLEEQASKQPPPDDWCYVHDFADRSRPRALRLPAGRGAALVRDMESLVRELEAAIPRTLEGEDLRSRLRAVEEAEKKKRATALEEVEREAKTESIVVLKTPDGMALAPMRDDEILTNEQVEKLPAEERDRIRATMEKVGRLLEEVMRQAPRWHRESHAEARRLTRDATANAVKHIVDELRARWSDLPEVKTYLDKVEADVIEHGDAFAPNASEEPSEHGVNDLPVFRRYRVNLVVDNGAAKAPPVIYEDHPTHANLFGRVEHISVLGALLTDFNLIKTGAVQRANGGYLLIDALKLLRQPFSWDELKRALHARRARIESPMADLGLGSTISLAPEPIPLELKVVLVGDRRIYYLLAAYDPEFRELFKIAADFEEEVEWTDETLARYARLIATTTRREKLLPLEAGAVARVIEETAREASARSKLALDIQAISDLLREANHLASRAGVAAVGASHVRAAVEARIHRSDRLRDVVHDQIRRGVLLVDTTGKKVGQANGLSVLVAGELAFARPSRITARARMGPGGVVDVEKEVELGGPIHSKGVLILEGFLAARYAKDVPLALQATLVFEQSYGGVEGDSASLAELCALLSAIGDVPLAQSIAITGSVNQLGEVQPVGGVNEKIEGFFDACRLKGLTGEQGVAIPAGNVDELMLREDVIEAVAAGRFHVHAVETVDDALALLAGLPAGARGADGEFPDGSVNGAVEARLIAFAEAAQAFEVMTEEREDERKRSRLVVVGDGEAGAKERALRRGAPFAIDTLTPAHGREETGP